MVAHNCHGKTENLKVKKKKPHVKTRFKVFGFAVR